MKTKFKVLWLVGAMTVCTVLGCATFKSSSGKFLASTAQTVDAAMQGYALMVATRQVNAEQQTTVRNYYIQYQAAMNVASNAWETSLRTGDKTVWVAASNTLYQRRTDILANAGGAK